VILQAPDQICHPFAFSIFLVEALLRFSDSHGYASELEPSVSPNSYLQVPGSSPRHRHVECRYPTDPPKVLDPNESLP
jgi:hypothetical protein